MQGTSDRPRVVAIAIVALGFWGQAQTVQARSPLVTRVPGHCDGARRLLASSARRRPSHRSHELYAGRRCHRRAENRLCAFERRRGGRFWARPIHAGGGARLHAFAFLGPAWLGNRGSGSGYTLHWPQPGDDRCAAVMEHRRLLRLRRASLRAECSEIAQIDSPDFRVSRRCSGTGAARG
jgi:hypothetical protein